MVLSPFALCTVKQMIRKEQENSAANLRQCLPSFHFLLLSILVSSFHLPISLKLSDHAVWRIHFIRILQSSMVSVKAKLIQG
jgi:hypothetical protein